MLRQVALRSGVIGSARARPVRRDISGLMRAMRVQEAVWTLGQPCHVPPVRLLARHQQHVRLLTARQEVGAARGLKPGADTGARERIEVLRGYLAVVLLRSGAG